MQQGSIGNLQKSGIMEQLAALNGDTGMTLADPPTRQKCPTKTPKPKITIIPEKATVHNSSKYEAGDKLPIGIYFPFGAAGLTALGNVIPHEIDIEVGQTKSCYYTKAVNMRIGYHDIHIYIDKQYKKGTCQYKKINAHEQQHAKWAIDAATFFAPDLKRVLQKAAQGQTATRKKGITSKQWQSEQKEKFLYATFPVLKHIQKKINEKNGKMDTPESYRKATEEIIRDCY